MAEVTWRIACAACHALPAAENAPIPAEKDAQPAVRSEGAISMIDLKADLRYKLQGAGERLSQCIPEEIKKNLLPTTLGLLLLLHAKLTKPKMEHPMSVTGALAIKVKM
eukprot:1160285-Pelagomonas_calceolata.AAC.9